jgi:hypothetical protein
VASLKTAATILLCALIAMGAPLPVPAAAPTEQQVKAVFLFNFSNFVQWPEGSFREVSQPFVIGLLGGEELLEPLEEAVRGEHVDGHPLQVRRYDSPEQIDDCHILFIGRAGSAELDRVLARLNRRGTLTVSDQDGASRRGVMIQLANERSRIRLLINVDEAQAAGLTISSNLLRPAEIVRTSR